MDTQGWQFWIDRGGTFTDIIARAPDGALKTMKLLSENPAQYRDAASEGIRRMFGGQDGHPGKGRQRIAAVKMGTTVATNALLERKGEPVVLVTTAGLGDVLRIGTQNRPDIFALDIRLPPVLYDRVIEATERMSAHGEVVTALDENALRAGLEAAHAAGLRSVAIAFLHGYRFPDHELRAAGIARAMGFDQVSVSHQISPLMKLVPRGHTTLVDAYLSPVLDRYIRNLREGLHDRLGSASLLFMQSHGGLVRAEAFRGKDSLLSGPAAGVVGMAAAAETAGLHDVIGFDMGGTSTDVALYQGEFERTGDSLVAGVRVNAPMMRIHTVAAGGGSVLRFDSGRLQAGPDSAGAWPGPACYRNGGPLTVTDANLLLGRIQSDHFPQVFGPQGNEPLDRDTVAAEFERLAAQVTADSGESWSAETLAAGFLRIAVEKMANAIKTISVQRGHDVTAFALVCFGGAGGQHACQVADALGIRSVLIHPLAGVLSAYGMGIADLRCMRQQTVEAPLEQTWLDDCAARFAPLERDAVAELADRDADDGTVTFVRRLKLKPGDADTALAVSWTPDSRLDDLLSAFAASHRQHFGFDAPGARMIVESIEVEAIAVMARPEEHAQLLREHTPTASDHRDIWFDGERQRTPVFRRTELQPGATLTGPALIVESNATTVVEPGWQATVNAFDHLLLERSRPAAGRERLDTACDPVMLEVFNNLFMHIAEQMGAVLESTAWSVNIKERLDFSCAIFDAHGDLIANAPHVPVHLGSMGDSVQSILRANAGRMRPGDVYLMNAPYSGGTHLPDITVVTPVFDDASGQLRFTVACRAHHADIGGISPGSMPAESHSIEQEGILFENLLAVRGGAFREHEIREQLSSGPFPARNPDQNIADLKAQIAANARGVSELEGMVKRFSLPVVHAYMQHIKDNAEQCVRRAISHLSDGRFELTMDGGERIAVSVRTDPAQGTAIIDFSGTGPQSARNFNAPSSIARAAVLYVFRTLISESIPLNAGCLKPLKIVLPENSLVDPRWPAAVVAGNVETSQCITDALLAALSACAASQGTMNNLTFGNAEHQYYETLCGGAGAGPDFHGASAVHTHMTNSRLTDPEVLEWRYPVRLVHFGIRHGSGGAGRHHGGDGVIREIEFLVAMHAAILSNRRNTAPFGLAGGEAGLAGSNRLLRLRGEETELGATAELELLAGDRLRISTPGGGGFGAVSGQSAQDGT
jgi:5-oxoprolinase (ATP-hydrolysing)